jgi:hypothetical protein
MDASDNSIPTGESANGSIEYDPQYQVRRFIDAQGDYLCDLAGDAREFRDLQEVAEKYRQLSREAAFIADVIERLGMENQEE